MTSPRWRPGWRTPAGGGNVRVDISFTDTGVRIRDSKSPGRGPAITFTPAQWASFLYETVRGLPSSNGAAVVTHHDGLMQVRATNNGTVLHFTAGQWADFLAGARSGEFDYRPDEGEPLGHDATALRREPSTLG